MLVTNLTNLRYLTGFSGSNGFLLVDSDAATFLTDGRYGEVAARMVDTLPATELVVYRDGLPRHLAQVIAGAESVGLESESVTWAFMRIRASSPTSDL